MHTASLWLAALADVGRSPHTMISYGRKVAHYLSWVVTMEDWRAAKLSHVILWRRGLAAGDRLSPDSIRLYIVALRSFYEWADSRRYLRSDVAQQMTEVKYFPAGSAAGGERGAIRRVTSARLRDRREFRNTRKAAWIDNADARGELEELELRKRDRLLVDLFYFTGIRAGEALSLFTADMHFGGGDRRSNCNIRDPHLHVRTSNPVENEARAKGQERTLFVQQFLVDRYIDYVIERMGNLGESDASKHVFVNLYTRGPHRSSAMRYPGVRDLIQRCGEAIKFPMDGPHILRHTFATRLLRGIDCTPQPRDVVSVLLGHRSRSSIEVYVHDTEKAERAAMIALKPRRMVLAGG